MQCMKFLICDYIAEKTFDIRGTTMQAWVTIDRNHKPYISTIFARQIHKGNWDKYEIGYHEFCVVLNEEKTKLIRVDTFQNIKTCIEVHVADVNDDRDHWLPKDKYYGCVDFLEKYNSETLVEDISSVDLQKCINFDKQHHYQKIHEVKNEKDAHDLLVVSGGFNDALIKEVTVDKDQIKILFGKAWGMQMELLLEGDPSFHLDPDIDEYSWWPDCSIFYEDGYWGICDGEDITSFKEPWNGIWFKAKKYIIRFCQDVMTIKVIGL